MEQKETVCSVAKKCGGCRYQGVSYQEQLRRKQRITENGNFSFMIFSWLAEISVFLFLIPVYIFLIP